MTLRKNNFALALTEIATVIDHWRRSADDHHVLMQSASRFDKNSDVAALRISALRGQITHTPLEVKLRPQDADLSRGVRLILTRLTPETGEAVKQRLTLPGLKEAPDEFALTTQINPNHFSGKTAKSGACNLDITPRLAIVVACDANRPLQVNGAVAIRSVSRDGQRTSRVETL